MKSFRIAAYLASALLILTTSGMRLGVAIGFLVGVVASHLAERMSDAS